MPQESQRTFPLNEALQAQQALREAAGMGPEQFPIQAFIGMISDEIETLRSRGYNDEAIAALIAKHSPIQIFAAEIAEYYAPPEARQRG